MSNTTNRTKSIRQEAMESKVNLTDIANLLSAQYKTKVTNTPQTDFISFSNKPSAKAIIKNANQNFY